MQKLHRLISGEQEIAVKSVVYADLVVRESCGAQMLQPTDVAPALEVAAGD
jgi:hypothetical protein